MIRPREVSLILLALCASSVVAHEPYVTDDPDPVDYHHTEIFVSTQSVWSRDDYAGVLPYFELNYGAVPEVELHLQLPLNYDQTRPAGKFRYGYGDTELGVKWRFLDEDKLFKGSPEVALSPLFEIPTGSVTRGLGNGQAQYFLPLFAGETWGSDNRQWNLYGGGGYWINLGGGNKNYALVGAVLQRQVTDQLTLGGELYYGSSLEVGQRSHLGFNLGAIYDFTDHFSLLVSAGRDLQGDNRLATFCGVEWTF
jgi:hypothetical protein